MEQSEQRPYENGRFKRTWRSHFIHRSVESGFSSDVISLSRQAGMASLVGRNSVPSTQMRCIITA